MLVRMPKQKSYLISKLPVRRKLGGGPSARLFDMYPT